MNVVVGKTATQTSIFKGHLSTIVLNPYWGIPTSIVKNEILQKLKRNTDYLSDNNMEVLSGNTVVNPNKINWKNIKTMKMCLLLSDKNRETTMHLENKVFVP